ncbi:MAG: GntR family transcriptional regulator [Deltaproteobacteria bacterium]|nr:GntR family transcriptional regulator [Deltaproteobacteria bacterium]
MIHKKVDKRIPIPAYYQLREILREKIANKEWKLGEKILSETELSEIHGINRMTVRQAILELCREGLLYREKGKGTFVAKHKVERDLSDLDSLTSYLQSLNLTVKTKVLEFKAVPASKKVAGKLAIPTGAKAFRLVRLRFLNQTPFFLETSFLPIALCPQLIEDDLAQNSLYDLLENKYGLHLDSADVLIEAISADGSAEQHLRVKKGGPLVRLEQVTYLDRHQPIQYLEAISRSDKYKYHLIRQRRKGFHL